MTASGYPPIYIYKRVVQAKLFIDRNYHRRIQLAHIADEAFFSKYHFIRLFKQIYGMTPHRYLVARRIDAARHLLRTSRRSVIEICFDVGFESVTSFTSLFKKMTGRTPRVFRSEYRHLARDMQATPRRFIPGCFAAAGATS